MKTKAAVLIETGKPLELMELETPPLAEGQVLVEVAASGLCHTQLSEVRGRRGVDRFLPHVLGHEGAGTVLETGPGVSKVKPGDRVVLTWLKGSGIRVPGTKYQGPSGPVNSGAISTFMSHTVTSESCLVPIPEDIPFAQAALLGCAVPTGAGMVVNTAGLREGQSVAVFGSGGVGLSAVAAAASRKAALIAAVDIVPAKLVKARELGATHVLDANKEDPVAALRELTGGRGVDLSIETAGRQESMEAAFSAVRPGGGLCVLAGNLPFGEKISIDPFELIKGKRITGSWGGETDPDRDIPEYAKLYLSGALDLDALLTHRFRLDQVNDALDALERGEVGRAVLMMS